MQRYYSYNNYLKDKFGCKMYKLSLSISNTCPNRDGTKGVGGCIFCSGEGSGDFAASFSKSIDEQIIEAKKRVENKNRGGNYVAYFQSYTSTYISPQKLKDALYALLNHSEIKAVSIATRADCLGDEILKVLEDFSKIMPLTVELGLQTVNQKTARLINRCCELCEFEAAVKKLAKRGIETVYHIIAGLPFESEEDFLKTVEYVSHSGVSGVKIQLLHILKATALEKMFEKGEFNALSMDEYFSLVSKALTLLPPQMVIHRLTGDGNKKLLVEPKWSGDKKRVLNALNRYLEQNDVVQGAGYSPR